MNMNKYEQHNMSTNSDIVICITAESSKQFRPGPESDYVGFKRSMQMHANRKQ